MNIQGEMKMGEYENTLEDIKNTLGRVPGFMKLFSRESLIRDWPSWKQNCCDEIYLERASFLLCADGILEEELSGRKVAIGREAVPEQIGETAE